MYRAVVLGDEQRRIEAGIADRLLEGGDGVARQVGQRGVQQAGILALQQADAAEIGRAGDRGIGNDRGDQLGGAFLVAGVERREDRGDPDRAQPGRLHLLSRLGDGRLVERHEGPAVILVAAFDHPDAAAHQLGQILRPVAERRQRGRGWHAEPQRPHLGEMAALHDRIDEMRRADHHAVDALVLQRTGRTEVPERVQDTRGDVLAGRGLDGPHDLAVLDQNGVRVGAADIDADTSHDENTLLKSRS